jgi:putative protein-disulfide isomerase
MEEANGKIHITVFTDPLCCWSWAFEPQLQQLRSTLGKHATWEYHMGGLIPSWDNFHDNTNAVSRSAQMGPVWMHAGKVAGKPICHQLWINDPPASSYPSCIAVKCAQLQSPELGELLLYLLRNACMTDGENIAKQDIIFKAAKKLAAIEPVFNLQRFKDDFLNDNGLKAFRTDLELLSYYRINRFPALVVKGPHSKAIIITGYKHYEEVLSAIHSLKEQNVRE